MVLRVFVCPWFTEKDAVFFMIALLVIYGVDGILDVISIAETFNFVIGVIKYDDTFADVIVVLVVTEPCLVDGCVCTISDEVIPVASNDMDVDGSFSVNVLLSECEKIYIYIKKKPSTFLYK